MCIRDRVQTGRYKNSIDTKIIGYCHWWESKTANGVDRRPGKAKWLWLPIELLGVSQMDTCYVNTQDQKSRILEQAKDIFNDDFVQKLDDIINVWNLGLPKKLIVEKPSKEKRNIIVCGTEINSNPAAEITWALILGLYRNMKQEIDNMFQGYWQTTIGFELKGKMLGLIGLGKIGTQVAKVAKAFGMEVCAWSENLNLSHANELGVLPMSKEDLLKNSDIISIHLVLGERYKNLITKKEIEMMKKTTFIINTSRGPIINENDLVEALKDEKIAGAGLDVFDLSLIHI